MTGKDDAFLQRLEDAMRAEFFPDVPPPGPATKHAEAEMIKTLASRYPNFFSQAALDNTDTNSASEGLSRLIQDWRAFRESRISPAYTDTLETIAQGLQESPFRERDPESVERIVRSTRQIKASTNHIDRLMETAIPMLKSATDFLFSDRMDFLADPSLSNSERAAQAEPLIREMLNLPGLNEGITELEEAGVTGFSSLLHRRLGSFTNMMRDFQRAAERSKLPDLSQVDEFRYQPLTSPTSIRVLRVETPPSSGSDANPNLVTLRINEVDLTQDPDFNALSYVWGDHRPPLARGLNSKRATQCFNVLCNGRRMAVTYNLFCFLRRLAAAKEGESLYSIRNIPLWVDQLCINQSDNAEKVTQVAMMDGVYSQGRAVVSWLGEGDSHVEGALRLLGILAGTPRSKVSRSDFDVAQFVKDIPDADWLALGAFLARPYFKRAWIVQEIAMANRLLVVCGEHVVNWDDLVHCSLVLEESRAWTLLSRYVDLFRSVKDQISSPRQTLRFGGQLAALLEAQHTIKDPSVTPANLLLLGRQFDATIAADKYFALLGLHRRRLRTIDTSGLLTIDYTKPLKAVALDFAKYYTQSSGRIDFLSLVEDPAFRTPGSSDFPSWLPDPAAPLLPMPLDTVTLRNNPILPQKQVTINGTTLLLQGRHLDTVSHTAIPFATLTETGEWFRFFNFLSTACKSPTLNLGRSRSTLKLGQALWRTLTASPESLSDKSPSAANLDSEFCAWCISLVASVRNSNRRMLDPMTADAMLQLQRLEDTEFDALAFGKDAAPIFVPDGKSEADAVLRSVELRYDYMNKREAERQTRDESKLAGQLEDALKRVWEVDKDEDVFPSPRVVVEGMEVSDFFLVEEDRPGKREMQHKIDTFKAAVGMKLDARRLFWTRDGRLGVGSQSVEEGDEVWLVDGVQTPVVLRRKRTNFGYMGQAYVLGAMSGGLVEGEGGGLVDILLE